MRLSELLYQTNAWALYSDLLFLLHLERKIDFLQLLTEESPNNIPAFQFFWTPGLEGCRSSGHHWRRIFLSAPGSQRISDGSVFDHSIGGFGDPFLPWNSVCFSWSVLLFSCVLPPVNRPFTHSLTWYWYQIPHNYFFARIQSQCFSFSAWHTTEANPAASRTLQIVFSS